MDGMGSVYVSGYTPNQLGSQSYGGYDAFIAKVASDGTRLWDVQFGTAQGDRAYDITMAQDGGVYVAGITSGGLHGNTLLGEDDAFVAKYSSNGQRLWTRQFGSNRSDNVWGVTTDATDNIYVTGQRRQSDNTWDAYVTKLSSSGSELWTWQSGIARSDYAFDVSVDVLGNVFVGGAGYPAPGYSDIYVHKVNQAGNTEWSKIFDVRDEDRANDVEADGLGNVYVSGYTNNQAYGFLWKLDGDGNSLWTNAAEPRGWGLCAFGDEVARLEQRSGQVQITVTDALGNTSWGGAEPVDFLRVWPRALAYDDIYGFAVSGYADSVDGAYDIFVQRYEFVPEPTSFGLVVFGSLALLRRRGAA